MKFRLQDLQNKVILFLRDNISTKRNSKEVEKSSNKTLNNLKPNQEFNNKILINFGIRPKYFPTISLNYN